MNCRSRAYHHEEEVWASPSNSNKRRKLDKFSKILNKAFKNSVHRPYFLTIISNSYPLNEMDSARTVNVHGISYPLTSFVTQFLD